MPKETTVFLLIEDDANDVFFVAREFEQAPTNLCLQVANDGGEAKEYLEGKGSFSDRSRFPMPHIILLDLKMPRVSGFEFLEWLRRQSPGNCRLIPVVVMSSSSLPRDIERAYALGANSYMIKPVDWTEFRNRIRQLGIYWGAHVETPAPQNAK